MGSHRFEEEAGSASAGLGGADDARGNDRPQGLRFEWVRSIQGIERLEPHWRTLASRARERMAFGGPDFLIPWYRHNGPVEGTPLVGLAWLGGRLVGLVPLAFRDASLGNVPVRRVDTAAHDGHVGEFLVSDDVSEAEVLGGLFGGLADSGGFDVVLLHGLAPGSARFRAIAAALEPRGLSFEETAYRYATVDLGGGYEAYVAARSAKQRGNLRRRMKRAADLGGVELDRLNGAGDLRSVDAYLSRAFAIGARSWKAEATGPMQERYRAFYGEMSRRTAALGMLDLSILSVGGRDAAFIMGLIERGTYFDVTVSYDEEFASVAPGILLMHALMERLAREGVRHVVSHGDHPYKRAWATAFVPQSLAAFFTRGLRGALSRAVGYQIPRLLRRVRGNGNGNGDPDADESG